jgi:hypothetical protein
LIDLAVKGISSLVKSAKAAKAAKGSGAFPPNARGAYPPNARSIFGKGVVKNLIRARMDEILAREDAVRNMRGKQFWRSLLQLVEDETAAVLEDAGLSEEKAFALSKASLRRVFPRSFFDLIGERPSGKGVRGEIKDEGSQLRSILRVPSEWAVKEVINSDPENKPSISDAEIRKLVDEALIDQEKVYTETMGSGKKESIDRFWDKTRSVMKKVGKVVIPQLVEIKKIALPFILKEVVKQFMAKDIKMGKFESKFDAGSDMTGAK